MVRVEGWRGQKSFKKDRAKPPATSSLVIARFFPPPKLKSGNVPDCRTSHVIYLLLLLCTVDGGVTITE